MPHDLRFFTMILPNQPWPELLRRYRLLEDLGFDLAAFADHFVDWTGGKGTWFECFTLLTAVASHTSRIRLGAYVAQIPLRNPALLAHQALTLDHVSNGRLELGLGLGLPTDPSYAMMGLPNWTNRERVKRFPEYVQLVDRLLRDDVTTYHGQHYQADGAVTQPRPIQKPRPPIVIAAMGPIMLRHAARYADTWNSISFADNFAAQVKETRERILLVDEHCAKIGRDPHTLRRSYLMLDVQARRTGKPVNYYTSKDAFAEMARQIIELGVSEIGLYFPTQDNELAIFEAIATEVIPALKQEYRHGGRRPTIHDLPC
jgi:alkanesulfonate monooxygenase SsuD/methylene tetrahydromethanopterin reductase-like flavin-dependent oxidoreductase (luciferase family)